MKNSLYLLILVVSIGAYAQSIILTTKKVPELDREEKFEVEMEESMLDLSIDIVRLKEITEENPLLRLKLQHEIRKLQQIQSEISRIEELAKSETGAPGV
tara:strand:+ start:91349 stop:91648 length:300 start_codon:yes stop_codon:yes gene_type:complete